MKLFDLLFQRKNSEEKQLELRLDGSHLIDYMVRYKLRYMTNAWKLLLPENCRWDKR